jgi:1,4-dihydroxy-2-naphthoate octaprenyltransferase
MNPERLLAILLGLGFLAAPPIALLYGSTPGLFVLAAALAITIALTANARQSAPAAMRPRLARLSALNAVLLAAALVGLVVVNL